MQETIIFIKLNKFHSKAKDKDYYTIEYIMADSKKYYMEFISAEMYDKIDKKNIEFLEMRVANFGIGQNRNLIFKDIE